MGLRLRLKASYSLARFHGESLVILQALKTYGMIVADNGSSWYITGAADPRWNDNDLDQLKSVPGSAFEAVNTGADPPLARAVRGRAVIRVRRARRTRRGILRRIRRYWGAVVEGIAMLQRVVDTTNGVIENTTPGATLEPDVVHRVDGQGPDQPHGRRRDDVRDLGRAGLGSRRHARAAHGRRQRGRRPEGRVGPRAERAMAAFEPPGAMEKIVTLPFGQMPAGVALNIAIFDVATHAVDLARATGQHVTDTELLEGALAIGRQMVGPELRAPGVFGDEQPVSDSGVGRRPAPRLRRPQDLTRRRSTGADPEARSRRRCRTGDRGPQVAAA